eukprot:gnl/MRDRNA2_/MRDRNA2_64217_c0_seq1.p1 gnl/MRDRNA2_/MRDRNA2_64217_c0~~gnl/MRDRNA2_/MRDRNA2_64217_c0_seq1.p1  ORF type:complete len:149 (+),score=33.80 gnl/MRDRNA2_/MRDRNA2_64217_c0_seq1:84-530(+)
MNDSTGTRDERADRAEPFPAASCAASWPLESNECSAKEREQMLKSEMHKMISQAVCSAVHDNLPDMVQQIVPSFLKPAIQQAMHRMQTAADHRFDQIGRRLDAMNDNFDNLSALLGNPIDAANSAAPERCKAESGGRRRLPNKRAHLV